MCKLKIDDGFNSLVYPINREKYDALEENIFDNGCDDPILVWNNIIIDGKKRYEICKKWDLPFQIQRLEFDNWHDAASWICKNQLHRNDLPEEMRRYLIGKCYESEKNSFLIRQNATNSTPHPRGYQYKYAELLSEEFHLVAGTIYKYGIYARAVDNICLKNRSIAERILSGTLRISQSNIVELSKLPQEKLRALCNSLAENNQEHVSYAEMRQKLNLQDLNPSLSAKNADDNVTLPIKKLPKYDPDAEISSLALTIPSWISSIERVNNLADFSKTTDETREKLETELFALHKTIYNIQNRLKEAKAQWQKTI